MYMGIWPRNFIFIYKAHIPYTADDMAMEVSLNLTFNTREIFICLNWQKVSVVIYKVVGVDCMEAYMIRIK